MGCDRSTEKLNLKFSCIVTKGAQNIEEADIYTQLGRRKSGSSLRRMLQLCYRNRHSINEGTRAMDTRPYMIRLTEGEFVKLAELSQRTGLKRALVVKRLIAEASESAQPVQFLRATGAGDD